MDVSALNLGMIAAYYNISCLFLLYYWLFFSILTCASRCDCWGVHIISERENKTERVARSCFILCRVWNRSYPPPRGRATSSHLRSCTRQTGSCRLRNSSFQDVPATSGPLFSSSTSTWPRGRPNPCSWESVESVVCLCWCHVFECMAERPWCDGPFTDVRAGSVGDGFSVEADPSLRTWCAYIFLFSFFPWPKCLPYAGY